MEKTDRLEMKFFGMRKVTRRNMPRFADMSAFQISVVGICLAINVLDGFDILAMAFAAPGIARDWGLTDPMALGALFSAALAAMVVGTIVCGFLADRIGRRPIILTGLILATAGMLLSAWADTISQLVIARVITGFAIGGIGPAINTIVAEYASPRGRAISVAAMQTGFVLGSAICGLSAAALMAIAGWQGIFWVGAVLAGLLFPFVWFFMPESLAILDRRDSAAEKVRTLRARMASAADAGNSSPVLSPSHGIARYWAPLALTGTTMFLSLGCFYMINNWTPTLLTAAGFPRLQSTYAGTLMALGGIPAVLGFGWLSLRFRLAPVIAAAAAASAALSVVFSAIGLNPSALMVTTFGLGIAMNMMQIGIYALLPSLFPAPIRASCTGLAVGLGRLGSAVGPWLAGLLLAAGYSSESLFALLSIPYILVALLMINATQFQKH